MTPRNLYNFMLKSYCRSQWRLFQLSLLYNQGFRFSGFEKIRKNGKNLTQSLETRKKKELNHKTQKVKYVKSAK